MRISILDVRDSPSAVIVCVKPRRCSIIYWYTDPPPVIELVDQYCTHSSQQSSEAFAVGSAECDVRALPFTGKLPNDRVSVCVESFRPEAMYWPMSALDASTCVPRCIDRTATYSAFKLQTYATILRIHLVPTFLAPRAQELGSACLVKAV
ncbi:hypothetical protein KC320_g13 [Hortaea werneckii]|nr:hypothetical protein KC320_g13 [Hortaea werneckii]